MSTKAQQFLPLLTLGLVFGSCSSAPEATTADRTEAMGSSTPSCPAASPSSDVESPAAPFGEIRGPSARGAVIHVRPPIPVVGPSTKRTPARITHLRREAEAARAHFAFSTAAGMFRSLRDDPATPVEMRVAFHTALGESEDIAYGMREVQRALDAAEFDRATRRYRALSIRHPHIPFSVLFGLSDIHMPGTVVPRLGH
jgi:hypothetical protein